MTRPRKRNDRRERITSLVLVLLVLALLWLPAATLQMTGARQHQAHVLRELALERIVLPEAIAEIERRHTAESAPPPKATLKRERMEALMRSATLEAVLPELMDPSATAELERRPVSTDLEIELRRDTDPVMPSRSERPRFSEDLDLGSPVRASDLPGRNADASGHDDRRISLAGRTPDSPAFTPDGSSSPRGRRPALDEDDLAHPLERRLAPPELPVIEPDEQMLDLSEEALDPDELIQWMRLRPGELPPGVKRHIDWRETDLTSTATIEHEGETYELYLMARMPIREIHVVLVRGSQTYYLIDRSFQHEGRKFRTGTARRSEAAITGVVSEERAAGSPEAAGFYSVFLSWWLDQRLRL
ncbi:MAG: hypothetical protein ACE5G0_17355 [Rhodothermales bacterium]